MAARRRRVSEENRVLCGDFSSMDEEALLLRVLAKLDPRDLFKLRLVCKSWYDAVLCPIFRQLYNPPAMDEIWSALTIRGAAGKPDETKLWRPLNTGSRLAEWSFPQLKGLCSSGGLVCGVVDGSLLVVNPITRERTQLPQLSDYKYMHGAFMETGADSSYKIVLLLEHDDVNDRYNHLFEAMHYDSVTRTWRRGGLFTASIANLAMAWIDCVGRPLVGSLCHSFIFYGSRYILACDTESEAWSYKDLEDSPPSVGPDGWYSDLIWPFKYKEKYYLASLVSTTGSGPYFVTGAGIWELDEEAGFKGVVSSTVLGNPFKVLVEEIMLVNVTLVGDTVFISTPYEKSKPVLADGAVWSPVAYDFTMDAWYTSLDKPVAQGEFDIECSYFFSPSFTARP